MGKRTPIAGHDKGARLSPDETTAIVDGWILPFLCDDETIGDFILIVRSICYANASESEEIVNAIERTLMPYSTGANDGLNAVLTKRLSDARKGGAR